MKVKMKMKIGIDLFMTVFLLMLMAYQIVGEKLHEWIGTGMLVLFVVHNLLNIRWYGNLLRGTYKPVRILRAAVNGLLFATMLLLAYSGIVMSRYVFSFLPIHSGMALSRVIHLAGSYWGFVLMSVHLGLHWGMVVSMFFRLFGGNGSVVFRWIVRLFAVIIAGYGAIVFYRADILSYMFLKVEFAFFDYEKSAVFVFAEYLAMMGVWVWIAYYAARGLEKISTIKSKREEKGYEKN